MNRQLLKYLLFVSHFGSLAGIIMLLKSSENDLSNIFLIILIAVWIIYNIILFVYSDSNDRRFYLFYPTLPKKIIHESGIYYVKYDIKEKKYVVYADKIFYSYKLFEISYWNVSSVNDLSNQIKRELDIKFKDKMDKEEEIKKHIDILDKWDGYTSIREKREDRINKVIK